jgi:nucleoside phosphorylase
VSIKLLVVDDDPEKLRKILAALSQVRGYEASPDVARDTNEAKRFLRQAQYDLVILDIALPSGPESYPRKDGGIELLTEVLERDVYNKPREVIGLTAFPDIQERASRAFAEDLWTVIPYDAASETWAEQLKRKVQYLILASKSTSPQSYGAYLCVMTALRTPELSAVLDWPLDWKLFQPHDDSSVYHRGTLQKGGATREVIATAAPRMGMTAAAITAMKIIYSFRPRYLAMAGITAGLPGRCNIGDVLAADPGWNWGSGKYFINENNSAFAPAPHQINLDSFIRGKLALMTEHTQIFHDIRDKWRGPKPNSIIQMRLGPVASGSAVLANPKKVEEIELQHRKILGIEMETYGVLAAAEECSLPQPKVFSLKSVCDFADGNKNDMYQDFAAYTSAATLRTFVERFL